MPQLFEEASAKPKLNDLTDLWRRAYNGARGRIGETQKTNIDTRYNIWPGKTADGRRWAVANSNENEVFPWPGASDQEVHLVDGYCSSDGSFLKQVWRRARTIVAGTEAEDLELAGRLTTVLAWLKSTQIEKPGREIGILSNLMMERGRMVLGVFWDEDVALGYEDLDLEMVRNQALEAARRLEQEPEAEPLLRVYIELPDMILDPAREEEAVTNLGRQLPEGTDVLQVVRDLRVTGASRFVAPHVINTRPRITALTPGEDIFWPPETTDMDEAPGIFWRESISETTLRSRAQTRGWRQDFVNTMLEKFRGKDLGADVITDERRRDLLNLEGMGESKLFTVVHAYRRMANKDGVPGIYYTVFHPDETKTWAVHELLNYDHGKYPFVLFEREQRGRSLNSSRGLGELVGVNQRALKVELDAGIDRNSVGTLPPSYHPPGQVPKRWGPGVRIESLAPDRHGFMQAPRFDPGNKEMYERIRALCDELVGRVARPEQAPYLDPIRQNLAETFLESCAQVDRMLLQLAQQFLPDEFYVRVAHLRAGAAQRMTRAEIQGAFDVTVHCAIEDLDPVRREEKLALIERALQMDVGGIVDRTEAISVIFELIDPSYGDRLLRPEGEASMAEIDDERQVFSQILNGLDVDIKPGQAYELRLRALDSFLQNNPTAQQRVQQDPNVRERLQKRQQQLSHQIEQFGRNARIGRLGA